MHLQLPDTLPPIPVVLFQDDTAFRRALGERIGQKVPHVKSKRGVAQSAPVGLGTLTGKAGQTLTASVTPYVLFRGEKLVSVDDANPPGSGTRITGLFIGSLNQFPTAPGGPGISSMALGPNTKNPMTFSPCQPGISITINVTFDKDCTWNGVLFGKSIS